MAKKQDWTLWFRIIIIWFIIISNIPELFPLFIFWLIFYFVIKNWKKSNTKNSWDIFSSIKNNNSELFERLNKVLETQKLQKQRIEKPEFTLSNANINKKQSISKSKIPYNTYKPKKTTKKKYTKNFISKNKKEKIYEYNSWKSIWDNYVTVVETMEINKR